MHRRCLSVRSAAVSKFVFDSVIACEILSNSAVANTIKIVYYSTVVVKLFHSLCLRTGNAWCTAGQLVKRSSARHVRDIKSPVEVSQSTSHNRRRGHTRLLGRPSARLLLSNAQGLLSPLSVSQEEKEEEVLLPASEAQAEMLLLTLLRAEFD